jgi:N-acetylglutamate synthase-like GNAT family acetyltransferase
MIEFLSSSQFVACCHLRPAHQQDGRQIRTLTRKLHQAAMHNQRSATFAASTWQEWLAWSAIGLTIAYCWQYPGMVLAVLVSSAPLWLIILLTIGIASREQQQQCERYWVMEYHGQLVGCGRLDPHPQHAEIYDLFVLPEWRSTGIGQAIMQQLIATAPRPIYLASLPPAVTFYQQLGFVPIASRELPLLVSGRLSLNSPRYRQVGLQPMILPQLSKPLT